MQQVLGPAPSLTYVCHYNHCDHLLELLPNGPSKTFPLSIWKSPIIFSSLSQSRAVIKSQLRLCAEEAVTKGRLILESLPTTNDVFKVVKRKPNDNEHYKFTRGKNVKGNLRLPHVSVALNIHIIGYFPPMISILQYHSLVTNLAPSLMSTSIQ